MLVIRGWIGRVGRWGKRRVGVTGVGTHGMPSRVRLVLSLIAAAVMWCKASARRN